MQKNIRRMLALLLIAAMVASQAGCGSSSNINRTMITEADPGIGSSAFSMITESLIKGIASEAGGFVTGWILNQLVNGGQDPTAAAIKDMQGQLNLVQGQLTQIQSSLSDLYKQANTNTDDIKATVAQIDISDYTDNIDALNQQLIKNVSNINPDSFAAGILHSTSGIPVQLTIIKDKVVGLGQNGVMDLLVAFLIDKAKTSTYDSPRLNAYLALEYYFGNLLTIQGQGLNLVGEAYHQIKANPVSPAAQYLPPGKDPIQALQDYIDNMYNPQIEAQMQKFLYCVELLVALTSDRTAPTASFLPDAIEIFKRADFIMEQWHKSSGTNGGNMYIRVIGEPERLKIYGDTWNSGNPDQLSFQALPGWPMGSGDQSPNAANTRSYPVSPHYAQWPPLLAKGTFTEAGAISCAKYSAAIIEPKTVTVNTPYDGSVTVTSSYYDNKMNQVDGPIYQITVTNPDGTTKTQTMNATLFGDSVIPARYDIFSVLVWGAYNDLLNTGYLLKYQDENIYANGVFSSTVASGTSPKSVDASVTGWASGSQSNFNLFMRGHLAAATPLTFAGTAAKPISIHSSIQAWLNENDAHNVVDRGGNTFYKYWFSTQDSADRQVKSFSVSGGSTSLNATDTLSINKTVSNGTTVTLETGYDVETFTITRMFHSYEYQLEINVQISRFWIDFPGT